MKRKYLNLLTLVCLVVCLVLSVGVAYGRYQWEFPRRSYVFAPELPDNIFLCGSLTAEWQEHGKLSDVSEKWVPSGDGVKLDFAVTNGNEKQVSQQEKAYSIRLAAGLNIEDPAKLTVTLYWWDDRGDIHWQTAVPAPIQKGSMLHASFGDGWVYQFYEENAEVSFSLTGGQLAYKNHTITVTGDVETTLLDLQILGQDSYQ